MMERPRGLSSLSLALLTVTRWSRAVGSRLILIRVGCFLTLSISAILVGPSICLGSAEDPNAAAAAAKEQMDNAQREKSAIASELNTQTNQLDSLKSQGAPCTGFDNEIAQDSGEISQLQNKKDAALAELRQGLFCSKCSRSKSEIEATGENFYDHIRRVGGQIIPASPEQIAAKQQEFDQKLAEVQNKLTSLESEKETCTKEYQARLAEVLARIRELQAQWWKLQSEFSAASLAYTTAESQALTQQRQEQQQALLEKQRELEEAKRRAKNAERHRKAEFFEKQRQARERLEQERAAEQEPTTAEDALAQQHEKNALTPYPFEPSNQTAPQTNKPLLGQGKPQNSPSSPVPSLSPSDENELQRSADANNGAADVDPLTSSVSEFPSSHLSTAWRTLLPDTSMESGDAWADRFSQALAEAESVAKTATSVAREKVADYIKQKLSDTVDDVFKEGPLTPEESISSGLSSAIKDLTPSSNETAMPSLPDAVKENIIDSIASRASEEVRKSFVTSVVNAFESGSILENPQNDIEKAQREFELSVSPPNLWYRTFPFRGLRAIGGLRRYLNESQDKFFRYFDLATDSLLEEEDSQ